MRWGLVLCQPESRGITVQALPKHPGEEEGSRIEERHGWMDGDGWKGRRNQVSKVEMKRGRRRVFQREALLDSLWASLTV